MSLRLLVNCIEDSSEKLKNNENGKYDNGIKLSDKIILNCEMIANGGFTPAASGYW